MMGPHVALSTAPRGTPVLVEAAVGARRWWARVWQFRATAYVEAWDDAGFDAETVVPTDDVAQYMDRALCGGCDLPMAAADVLFRAATTFAAAASAPSPDGALLSAAARRVTAAGVPGSRLLQPAAWSV